MMDNRTPLKILHVLSQRPDSTGSGIYLQAMLREAAGRGHTNYLVAGIQGDSAVALDKIEPDCCRYLTFGRAEGLPFPITGMSDVMPYESSRFCALSDEELDAYEAAFCRRILEAVETFGPDIIHSHHLWIVTSLTRRLLPAIPMVTNCHGSDLRQFQNCPHLRERVLSGCRGLDAVMALSRAQKQEIRTLYGITPESIHVAGAGYDDRLFFQTEKDRGRTVQLVYVGKLSHAKGVPWMLRALAGIDAGPWRLHLVGGGSGAEMAECLELAGQMAGRITSYGAVSQEILAGIMRRSHVFVLPSLFEGLPLVLLEALASGCRVVATALPGVKELVGDMPAAGLIDLVPVPRLVNVDEPVAEDRDVFEKNLQDALCRQITTARQRPDIDLAPIKNQLAALSWQGVFDKVEKVYYSL
ncbi:MAG: glycosyltransferase family 4 protein [Thermodesulfobacteriota bacterium]|nr:glycosyltransferase family 4 protein [Thermodesulfobacteriota bacterium]